MSKETKKPGRAGKKPSKHEALAAQASANAARAAGRPAKRPSEYEALAARTTIYAHKNGYEVPIGKGAGEYLDAYFETLTSEEQAELRRQAHNLKREWNRKNAPFKARARLELSAGKVRWFQSMRDDLGITSDEMFDLMKAAFEAHADE